MAKPTKTKAAKPKAKKAKAAPAKKPAARAAKKPAPGKAKRAAPKAKPRSAPRRAGSKSATINIFELIDHPLVADLLAVGAMAAVGAIADHNVKTRTGETESGSSKAIKAAGKAAASAVGKRLMTEVDAIKKASEAKPKKRGSK